MITMTSAFYLSYTGFFFSLLFSLNSKQYMLNLLVHCNSVYFEIYLRMYISTYISARMEPGLDFNGAIAVSHNLC